MNSIDGELLEAVDENNLPEVRRLLSVGADVNARNVDDCTPLHSASDLGHNQVVKELVEHGADIEKKDRLGWTPLHCAADSGYLPVVKALLAVGADCRAITNYIEAKNNAGNTPLHTAAVGNHLAIVKALLAVGANCRAINNMGRLPIDLAARFGDSEVAKYLLQHFFATTRRLPLHALLEDLTWIGDPYSSDAPPLHYALHWNVLGTDDVAEILEYLVDRNPASLSSRDHDGSLPLHVACRRGASFAIVQSLVNLYKASVKSVTPQGDLPLFLACETPEPSLDTIFLLMKLYPDVVYR
jgi:ankyrin repeat protein